MDVHFFLLHVINGVVKYVYTRTNPPVENLHKQPELISSAAAMYFPSRKNTQKIKQFPKLNLKGRKENILKESKYLYTSSLMIDLSTKLVKRCFYKDESVLTNQSDSRFNFTENSNLFPKYCSAFNSMISKSCFTASKLR